MTTNHYAIFGLGHVGKHTRELFPEATCFDPAVAEFSDNEQLARQADIAFVCVPTPRSADGSADVSIVEGVVANLDSKLVVIRSTVPPGTTRRLNDANPNRTIVNWPEFIGEWSYLATSDQNGVWPYVTLGGDPAELDVLAADLAGRLGANLDYWLASSETVEMAKYVDNAWLALQVLFSHQIEAICRAQGVSYWQVRQLWKADPRVSATHTVVDQDDPGFGGHCLPKDLSALRAAGDAAGARTDLLEAMESYNALLKDL